MATTIEVREEEDGEQIQTPLLYHHSSAPHGIDEAAAEILPSTSTDQSQSQPPNQRIVSLDVFRGLTVALMILVDDAGGAFPSINHSPWFGVTLADFVMPCFLFSVGVSVGLVFKKVPNRSAAIKKVLMRTIKLFLLGLLLQGGYFHGRHSLTYGVDIDRIRWFGVLQRISIGYFFTSISEIWLFNRIAVDSPWAFARKYYIQWMAAVLLCALYMCLAYGLYIPNWVYEASSMNFPSHESSTQVHCEVRGSLEPPCNAVGLIDRFLLGQNHLYQRPVYRRTKECSINSPDYGPLPPNAPVWCLAPFDPEGILSSLMAAITCFVGLHFGHILVHVKQSHMHRMHLWLISSFPLLIFGYLLEIIGIPLSKPLYTLSYMCITAGVAGVLLTFIYYMIDVRNFRKPGILLQWMGMNALIIYALAACELFPAAVQGFYWRSPENNLVDITANLMQQLFHSKKWGTLVFVMLEILFWGYVAGFLHRKGIYIRL